MMLHRIRHIGLALIIPVSALSAQTPADPAATFDKREVMVPMRDGVKLHTLDLHAQEPDREPPDHLHPHAVRHRRRGRIVRQLVRRDGEGGLHLRLPGHPRTVHVRRPVRHASPATRQEGPQVGRRSERHVRHDRLDAQERPEATTDASACSASRTRDGSPSWRCSTRIPRSRPCRRRRRRRRCSSATTSTTTARSASRTASSTSR